MGTGDPSLYCENIWSRFVSCKSLEHAPRSGRPMKLQHVDLEYSKCLKTERSSLTHTEVRDKLEENANISIDISTVCRAVKRKLDPVEWTRKRLVTPAGERFTDRNMAYKQVFINVLNKVMHQSFVSTALSGPGISGAFNFSIFKAPLKALHSGVKLVVKSLLKAPALPGTDNNEEQQMT